MCFNEDWRYRFTLANNICLLELISVALGHLNEFQKAEKYLIIYRWSLLTGFTVCVYQLYPYPTQLLASTGVIIPLSRCQYGNPEEYGFIIHSKPLKSMIWSQGNGAHIVPEILYIEFSRSLTTAINGMCQDNEHMTLFSK